MAQLHRRLGTNDLTRGSLRMAGNRHIDSSSTDTAQLSVLLAGGKAANLLPPTFGQVTR